MDKATADLLAKGTPGAHLGIVAHDDESLARAVAAWAAEGLKAGGGVILLGSSARLESVRAKLLDAGLDAGRLERAGTLVLLEADWLLAKLMFDGSPDATSFRALLNEILRRVGGTVGDPTRVRAWGELVSLLHKRGNAAAATSLERLWDEAIAQYGFSLLCSYRADGDAKRNASLPAHVAATHAHWAEMRAAPVRPDAR
ncbi:MAG: hypothetical protein QOE90_1554 [Thermoplasmata archaeon]|nr:hypothetical protein [Thermoplasmata archaeon]